MIKWLYVLPFDMEALNMEPHKQEDTSLHVRIASHSLRRTMNTAERDKK